MYGLAYVLVPGAFASLQAELDRTLAPFRRGGVDDFPRDRLAFDDATDQLVRLHRTKFDYNSDGSITWRDQDAGGAFDLRLQRLSEHMTACGLDAFEGTFAEIEPDFDAFVQRFTKYDGRDPAIGRYGRWLNPIGYWDWWELGGRFNGAITGDRRASKAEQAISSGPHSGRAVLVDIVEAFGGHSETDQADIEANVELIESLKLAADRNDAHWIPTALVLPNGCCADEDRWLDRIEWHEIRLGTRVCLGAAPDADFETLVCAAYERFAGHAAAGVAFHF